MKVPALAKYAGVGVVAGIAAYASYSHMRDLALLHGQTPTVAALLPVSVDGMLLVATLVMKEDRADGRPVRAWARIAFGIGVAASVFANVAVAAPDPISRVVSAWPAVALLMVIEMLASRRRKSATVADTTDATVTAPESVRRVVDGSRVSATVADTDRPKPTTVRPARKPSTAELVAKVLARTPDAGPSAVAAKTGLSERTVRRYMPRPADDTHPTDSAVPVAADLIGASA